MSTEIVIVGGGFAGVWAAMAAARLRDEHNADHVRIDLINPRDVLVMRPRLYEPDPSTMVVPLSSILDPIGVNHIQATVDNLDPAVAALTMTDAEGAPSTLRYDRLILASGSRLATPDIDRTNLHDIDTIEAAAAFDAHIQPLVGRSATIIVVGAGFTGIELAAELPSRLPDAGILLLERESVVGPELGEGPRPVITEALSSLGVDVRTGVGLDGYDGRTAHLSDGSTVEADAVVWTAGMQASDLTAHLSGQRDRLGRLTVDRHLRVAGRLSVFAAGDTAAPADEAGHVVTQSCQHAMPQGSCAGHNAVADLLGLPLQDFETNPYQTCLDLGAAGAVYTQGWDRAVKLTGAEAKALKRDINSKWIYPSVGVR